MFLSTMCMYTGVSVHIFFVGVFEKISILYKLQTSIWNLNCESKFSLMMPMSLGCYCFEEEANKRCVVMIYNAADAV